MSRQKHRERLYHLLQLLQKNGMGTAQQTAKQFGCHPSTIERMLRKLKNDGHAIVFDRQLKRYLLQNPTP